MAIQNRRGVYSDFTPTKMVPGEFAVVNSGDPNSTSGKGVYMSFADGQAKRLVMEEDVQNEVAKATEDIAEQIEDAVADDLEAAQAAATTASTKASEAAASASQAAQTVANIIDNTLSQTGKAADAKVTGDELAGVKEDLNTLEETTGIQLVTGAKPNHKGLGALNHEVVVNSFDQYTFGEVMCADGLNLFDASDRSATTTKGVTVTPLSNGAFLLNGTVDGTGTFATYSLFPDDEDMLITPGEQVIIKVYTTTPIRLLFQVWDTASTVKELRDLTVTDTNTLITNIAKAAPNTVIGYYFRFVSTVGAGTVYDNDVVWIGVYHAGTNFAPLGSASQLPINFNSKNDKINTLYYPSVATYIANTKEYVDALDVDINNKITYVTPERFYGDYIPSNLDAYEYISSAIEYAKINNLPVYCGGNYTTSQMIDIFADGLDLFINKITYTGTGNYAIRLCGRQNRIKINYINAQSGGGFVFYGATNGGTTICLRNIVDIQFIISNGHCIAFEKNPEIEAITSGFMSFNVIKNSYANSTNGNIIYIPSKTGVNENRIYGHDVRTSSNYAIYDESGSNYYYDFSLESGCYKGIYTTGVNISFINFRTIELQDAAETDPNRVFLKIAGYAYGIRFINNMYVFGNSSIDMSDHQIPPEDYAVSETSGYMYGQMVRNPVVYCEQVVNGRNNYYTSPTTFNNIVGGWSINWDGKVINKLSKPNQITVDVSNIDMSEQTEADYFVIAENSTIILSGSYCPDGIDTIYIEQTNGKKALIKNSSNTTVFDGSAKPDGIYKVMFVSQPHIFTPITTPYKTLYYGDPGRAIVLSA